MASVETQSDTPLLVSANTESVPANDTVMEPNNSHEHLTEDSSVSALPRGLRRRGASDNDTEEQTNGTGGNAPSNQEQGQNQEMSVEELKYGAKHFIKLFPPITACMIVTIILLKIAPQPPNGSTSAGVVLFAENSSQSFESNLASAFMNVGIVIAAFVIMTILLVLLYKFRCYCILKGWFTFAIFLIFFFLFTITILTMLVQMNIALDVISVFFFIWNVGVLGVISILWQAPLPIRQTYHIIICSLISFTLVRMLPSITTWILLGALVVWDLIAVLTPCGPLRKLIEIAQQRNEQESGVFNSIIYSTAIAYGAVEGEEGNDSNGDATNFQALAASGAANAGESDGRAREAQVALNGSSQVTHRSDSTHSEEERGVKLGLGDFVFYSVLIARATEDSADWNTTLACFLAILVGLCFTLILLAIWKHALPALPISLTFGLIFYFGTSNIVSPFTESLAVNMLFV